MKLPRSHITAFFLLVTFVLLTAVATLQTVSAQSYQNEIQNRASQTVPGVIDGLNAVIGGSAGNFQSSAIRQMAHLIAMPYANPPASGVSYVASLRDNFKLIPEAHAQAELLGYSGLLPIQPLWTMFRNIAYLGFVLMFIIIGFMIMLRVKLDPRTVVTVQQAIPSIIIGLILVTFSYAIVGFLIDLMFLFIALMVQIFVLQGVLNPGDLATETTPATAPAAQNALFQENLLKLARNFWGSEIGSAADAVSEIVGSLTEELLGGIVGSITEFVTAGLMKLILFIALFFAAIRTFISLIIAYVSVIILTIIGPLQIMIGVIPGQGGSGFGKWIRNVAGNLAVFPVVAFLILLAAILTDSGDATFGVNRTTGIQALGQGETALWRPPLLFGGVNNSDNIQGLVGLGLILLIPSAAQMTKDLFKTGGFAYGAAIASTVGAGAGVITSPFGVARRATEEATREGGATLIRKSASKIFGRSNEPPRTG